MYGLIAKLTTADGRREDLVVLLLEGSRDLPGCLSYVVARDPSDENALWVTEVWDDQSSHQASLSLPSVQQTIARGRPLITGFAERFVTEPVGGHGLGVVESEEA